MTVAEDAVPRHILIVEDDPNTAEMLSTYFSSLSYKVSHVAWGQDALKQATDNSPDLVVLDIHLPDIDGYEVCRRLRSQRRTEHIPIIFLTERRDRMIFLPHIREIYILDPSPVINIYMQSSITYNCCC